MQSDTALYYDGLRASLAMSDGRGGVVEFVTDRGRPETPVVWSLGGGTATTVRPMVGGWPLLGEVRGPLRGRRGPGPRLLRRHVPHGGQLRPRQGAAGVGAPARLSRQRAAGRPPHPHRSPTHETRHLRGLDARVPGPEARRAPPVPGRHAPDRGHAARPVRERRGAGAGTLRGRGRREALGPPRRVEVDGGRPLRRPARGFLDGPGEVRAHRAAGVRGQRAPRARTRPRVGPRRPVGRPHLRPPGR